MTDDQIGSEVNHAVRTVEDMVACPQCDVVFRKPQYNDECPICGYSVNSVNWWVDVT